MGWDGQFNAIATEIEELLKHQSDVWWACPKPGEVSPWPLLGERADGDEHRLGEDSWQVFSLFLC